MGNTSTNPLKEEHPLTKSRPAACLPDLKNPEMQQPDL